MFLVFPIQDCVVILLVLKLSVFSVYSHSTKDTLKPLPEELISELYRKYLDAVKDDSQFLGQSFTSLRRIFKSGPEYEIHVQKLKEVNGFKRHNLLIKEIKHNNGSPIIYINNPVESKISKAYLTIEEFKTALLNRAAAIQSRPITPFVFEKPINVKYTTHGTFPSDKLNRLDNKPTDNPKERNVTVQGNNRSKKVDEIVLASKKIQTTVTTLNSVYGVDTTKTREIESTTLTAKYVNLKTTTKQNLKTTSDLDNNFLLTNKTILKSGPEPKIKNVTVAVTQKSEKTLKHEVKSKLRNKKFTTKLTSRTRRSTLGRPLVFMGN